MSEQPPPCSCCSAPLTRRAALATAAGLLATACSKAARWDLRPVTVENGVLDLNLNDHPPLATPGGMEALAVPGVRHPLLIMRIENNSFRVFSLRCPHLGCTVRWDDGMQQLTCPCHGSTFDDRGVPQKGPAKQPLSTYPWQMMGTRLRIAIDP